VKIATWNINSINSRIEHVVDWCNKNQPDVLCLQETKCVDEKFPHGRFNAIGYEHFSFLGEKAYNGVAIISKESLSDIQKNFPYDAATAPKRLIAATIKNIHIVNAYVPHGTALGSDKFTYKLEWLARLRKYLDKKFKTPQNVILCGDLNIAPHELDVWKPSLWKDKIHFTKAERDALQDLKKWGFVDVFRQINDDVKEYSWWDYFHHSFEKDRGLRIDHIWASPPLAERCTDCWIDKAPRELDKPSDHAPVVAHFAL
jgi:exodeoxyribonuclease-3